MTYANSRAICDADSHLMELPDFLAAHADPADRERMPSLGALATGQFRPGEHAGKDGHDPETVARLTALGDGLTRGPKWHDALGAFSGPERAAALDLLGFTRQVIFSSFCARPIFEAAPDVAYAAARAHNRAMAAFCDADPRLIGVAIAPLDDVAAALAEIEHAHRLGLGAVWVAAAPPGGRSPGHVDHEPIWALLAERRMPFILHV
ncbi:MAG TPA: amidohydrolase family protein, partial [Caulobacteraceae bacterium]